MQDDLTQAAWRKSTYSGSNNECVEVRRTTGSTDVRDSKHRDAGHLTVSSAAWQAFLDATR